MKVGKHKLLVIAAGSLVLGAGVAGAALGQTELLLLLVLGVQVAGIAAVLQLIVTGQRRLQRRIERLEEARGEPAAVTRESPTTAGANHSVMPQAHAEQLLRTIEAQHARLEMSQDQLARRIERLLGRSGEG